MWANIVAVLRAPMSADYDRLGWVGQRQESLERRGDRHGIFEDRLPVRYRPFRTGPEKQPTPSTAFERKPLREDGVGRLLLQVKHYQHRQPVRAPVHPNAHVLGHVCWMHVCPHVNCRHSVLAVLAMQSRVGGKMGVVTVPPAICCSAKSSKSLIVTLLRRSRFFMVPPVYVSKTIVQICSLEDIRAGAARRRETMVGKMITKNRSLQAVASGKGPAIKHTWGFRYAALLPRRTETG